MNLRIRPLRILLVVALLAGAGWALRGELIRMILRPQAPPESQQGAGRRVAHREEISVVARDLETVWAIAFLPDATMLVTERPGRLTRLAGDERRAFRIAGVRETGEGGLMGLALHPRFAENGWLYVMLTADGATGLENRVERYRWTGDGLADRRVILDGIPAAMFHDGGRVAFGPDGFLYVTTGDATDGARAQDRASLAGKLLRLTGDGGPAPGNPFGTRVYSWGHRNPQGLAWDGRGRLWSTEHGPSGMQRGQDELNVIEPGANYGWPVISGDVTREGMVTPVLHSGADYTWAPAGAAYWDGSVFFGGLRGEALYEARVANGAATLRTHFYRDFGRIRAVVLGPDGMLYFGTSNRDGRGRTRGGDDKIVRVDPRMFRR